MAVRLDGALVAVREGDPSRAHATRLPGDLLRVLEESGAALRDVTLLAVGLGPGAFTGLRVGLAAMQGLAFATKLPVVGVSGLEALAVQAARGPGVTGDVVIGIWIDGARAEVFAARYRVDPSSATGVAGIDEPLAAPPPVVLDAWTADARMPTVWIGSGAALYESLLRERGALPQGVLPWAPLAPTIGELAERSFAAGVQASPHALRPLYVRRPDAELARDRGRSPRVESETRP